jgi:hypothetical protein
MCVKAGRPDGALTLGRSLLEILEVSGLFALGQIFPLPLQASSTRPLIVQPSIGSAGVKRWRASGTTLVPSGDADPIRAAGSPSSRPRWSRPTDEGEKHVPAHHQKRNRRPLRRGTAIEVLRDHERPDPHAAVAGREDDGSGLPRNRRGGTEPQAGTEIPLPLAEVLGLSEMVRRHRRRTVLFWIRDAAATPISKPPGYLGNWAGSEGSALLLFAWFADCVFLLFRIPQVTLDRGGERGAVLRNEFIEKLVDILRTRRVNDVIEIYSNHVS